MAFQVGEIEAKITADSSSFVRHISRSERQGESFAQKMQGVMASVSRTVTGESGKIAAAIDGEISSIDELSERIERLEQLRRGANDPAKVESYTNEIRQLTRETGRLKAEQERRERVQRRMNTLMRTGGALIASYISIRTIRRTIQFSREIANTANNIDQLRIKTGLATDYIQEFEFIADQLGASTDVLNSIMGGFSRRLSGLESGTGRASDAFRALGVAARTADGDMRSISDMVPELMAALRNIENPTQRISLATDIFGRRADALIPILDGTQEEVNKLAQTYREMGSAMDEAAIKRAAEFHNRMNQMQESLAGLRREAGFFAMDVVDKVAPALEDMVFWANLANEALDDMGAGAEDSNKWLGYLWDTVQGFGTGGLVPLAQATAGWLGDFTDKIRAGRGVLLEFGDELERFGQGISTSTPDVTTAAAESTRRTVADIREDMASVQEAIEAAFSDDTEAIRGFQNRLQELQKELDTALGLLDEMPAMLQNVERSARSISTVTIADGWNKQVQDATRQIEREFDVLRQKANIFEGFDLAGERVRVVERTLNDLIESGVNPNITQMQELIALYRELQIEAGGSIEEVKEKVTGATEEMKKLSEAAMTFGRIGSQAFDQLVFSGERFDQVLRSIFRQLANQAVFAGLTGGFDSLGALFMGRKMHGGGVVGGIGESVMTLRSGEAVFTPAQTRALGLMASRPSSGISESAMQSAFDKALAKHTSKLGPREIFVLSREGGRAMGRLN